MKTRSTLVAAGLVVWMIAAAAAAGSAQTAPPAGFKALFNGQDLRAGAAATRSTTASCWP